MNEIERLLSDAEAILVRHKRHKVYRLANGKTFVMSKTPGDRKRAEKNQIRDLRRLMEVK